jgi:hypothetical protein
VCVFLNPIIIQSKNKLEFMYTCVRGNSFAPVSTTIIYSSCTFKHVNVLRRRKCTLCKQTLSNICLTFIRTTLEYACDVLVEHNLQVEILFPLKQGGNICRLGVKIASWQHFKICIIHSVPNIWVIVYLLQYTISMITISEAMKTMQHHKVNY